MRDSLLACFLSFPMFWFFFSRKKEEKEEEWIKKGVVTFVYTHQKAAQDWRSRFILCTLCASCTLTWRALLFPLATKQYLPYDVVQAPPTSQSSSSAFQEPVLPTHDVSHHVPNFPLCFSSFNSFVLFQSLQLFCDFHFKKHLQWVTVVFIFGIVMPCGKYGYLPRFSFKIDSLTHIVFSHLLSVSSCSKFPLNEAVVVSWHSVDTNLRLSIIPLQSWFDLDFLALCSTLARACDNPLSFLS